MNLKIEIDKLIPIPDLSTTIDTKDEKILSFNWSVRYPWYKRFAIWLNIPYFKKVPKIYACINGSFQTTKEVQDEVGFTFVGTGLDVTTHQSSISSIDVITPRNLPKNERLKECEDNWGDLLTVTPGVQHVQLFAEYSTRYIKKNLHLALWKCQAHEVKPGVNKVTRVTSGLPYGVHKCVVRDGKWYCYSQAGAK